MLDFKIIREVIHVQDVKYTQILEDKIGYVHLAEFREDSATEFRKALDQLKKDGADSLILDLRNNPGGLLNVAIRITEEFITPGQIIVSTKGRHQSENTITYSNNKDHLIDWPMVVLINEGSASGSEILAGALKDNKRAILVGVKSFGKGSVQSVIPLPDGSGLRLTTSKYFTPSGISIHEKGIIPDVVVEPKARKEEEKEEKNGKDEKEQSVEKVFDKVTLDETKDPEKLKQDKKAEEVKQRLLNDIQVQTAINVLKGIRVFKKFDGTAATPVVAQSEDNKT